MILQPIEVAKMAWQKNWKDGTDFGGWIVLKDNKMVTLVEKPQHTQHPNFIGSIVVFPRTEHMGSFVNASYGVQSWGPAFNNRGAVLTLTYRITRGNLIVEPPQHHYITTMDKEFTGERLPRALHTKYAGARARAITAAVNLGFFHSLPVWLKPVFYDSRRQNRYVPLEPDPIKEKRLARELVRICVKNGWKFEKKKEVFWGEDHYKIEKPGIA
ncbi:MAG: hypothetical protein AABX01_05155 [Candidatus Micrarchaeota archaeon]